MNTPSTDSGQIGPNPDPEIAEFKRLVNVAGHSPEAKEARAELGKRLIVVRARFPKSGPKARAWIDFLTTIGLPKKTANNYMREAAGPRAQEHKPQAAPIDRVLQLLKKLSPADLATVRDRAAALIDCTFTFDVERIEVATVGDVPLVADTLIPVTEGMVWHLPHGTYKPEKAKSWSVIKRTGDEVIVATGQREPKTITIARRDLAGDVGTYVRRHGMSRRVAFATREALVSYCARHRRPPPKSASVDPAMCAGGAV